MKKQFTVTLSEALAAFIVIGLLGGLCLYLQRSLSLSRANEREMSKRYSELVNHVNPPIPKHK